ncbi:MAG: excinuclease ABC subunit UvrC [Patescibacteria group bacterium]
MSIPQPLIDKIKHLPANPGIYRFLDEDGQVLYVGKAINLKNRVGSYVSSNHSDRPWIAVMMGLARDVEAVIVENELEALLVESSFIKEFEPKFNIKLTDDKSFPFIQLNRDEPFPRFSITRRRSSKAGLQYFGPYLSARAARFTLEFLRNLYGIHISPKKLAGSQRPCFYCQLSGNPCVLADEITDEKYRENITKAADFLRGKRKNLIFELRNKMTAASDNHQFELAAKLRDRLEALGQVTQRQQVVSADLDDYDAVGAYATSTNAAVVVQNIREGRLVGQRDYYFAVRPGETVGEIVRQFLVSFYRTSGLISKLVVIPREIADQDAIAALLADAAAQRVAVTVPERGSKHQMVELANRNAKAKLELKLLGRGDSIVGVLALQELLKLKFLPERIEAIDISNLGKSEAVGASVSFHNGQPDKDNYRRYIIKTVTGQNDFAMIREVVSRRLHDTARLAPDLLVIDGGPEQLKFALQGAEGAPMQPKAIISLAKKPDRVFLPGKKMPLSTPRGHKGLRLLARIRDEVHRFGITFQRSRQRKKSLGNSG